MLKKHPDKMRKSIFKLTIALGLFCCGGFNVVFAQPANNVPCSATNMGTLPTPGACTSGLQNGAATTLNSQTTVGATGATPYVYQTGCSGGGQQSAPALDTWYTFTASGTIVNIALANFPNASVAIWTGSCNNLTAWGCMNVPNGGSASFTVLQTVVGQQYWVQVSGGTASATDASFSLSLDNDIDCNDCLTAGAMTASPAPVNGGYTAGQTVTFCYTITGYTQVNTNWLHGIQITFGAGWSGGIQNPVPANTLQNIPGPGSNGDWLYYPTGIGNVNGTSWGPGFYFDTPDGGTSASDNFGDDCGGTTCSWTFCWDMTVGTCTPGTSLNVTVNTSGDGESGSWLSNGCNDDNATNFSAIEICCTPPIMSQVNVLCNGAATGTATATGQGSSPWDYVWVNGAGTTIQTITNVAGANTVTGLAAGTYTVTVTDNANCVSSATVTITQPTLTTATEAHVNPLCFGGTTTATITATGGTPGYNVSWTGTTSGNPGGTEIAASGGTYNMTGLGAGTYNVTVTNANGCIATTTVIVTVPTAVVASNVPTAVTCSGLLNGSAVITASGGTPGYNVSWTGTTTGNPAGTEIAASGGTFNMTGLGAGTYNVTVTDVNGCTATTTVTINTGVVIDANISPIAAQCLVGNSFSFSGSTSTISSGSITSYNWNFGAGATPATATGVTPAAVTYSGAGTITVTLTVSNGTCTNVETLNITINANPTITAPPTPPLCFGGSTGSILVTASNGTPGYNVSWTGTSSGNPAGTEISASGGTFNMTGLTTGSYTITVSTSNGCTSTLVVPVSQPTVVTASDLETNVVCNGGLTGSGLITGSGGTAPYNVSWTGTSTGNPAGTEIAASGGTFNMTGLGIGTYNVTVTDSQGCAATTTVNITQTTAITLVPSSVNANCGVSNGTASVVASGGTNTFSYVWAPAPGGGQGTPNATGLAAGSYTVTLTDGNLCTANTTIIVGSNLAPIATLVSQVNVLCNGGSTGSAIVSATGGSPGYNISWTGPTTGNPAGTEIAASGGTFNITGMPAGVYTVTVSDIGTCTAALNITITQPTPVVAANITTAVLCFGATNGTAIITGSGGTAPYNVSWTGTTTGNPAGTEIAASGGTFTIPALGVGTYNVTVTDANGCAATTTATVTQPTAITITSATSINALCFGSCNGSVNATATGGTGALVFNWVTVGTGANQTGLCAGNYNLIVTDANNCSASQTVVVGQPTVLSAITNVVNANCGSANGTATATPAGGTSTYTYSWNTTPVQTTQTATGLIPGSYIVTVTDFNGCTTTATAIVGNNAAGTLTAITNNNVTCFGAANGQMTANLAGGAAPISYSWNTVPIQNTAVATGVGPGTYTVTATDGNGCVVVANTVVTQPIALIVNTTPIATTCPGGNNGSVSSVVSGGTTPYNLSWSNGPTTGTISGLTAASYTLTVTDGNGCTATSTSIVTQPAPFVVNISPNDATCKSTCNGNAAATVSGGTSPYTFLWNDPLTQVTSTASFLCAGNYNLTITDNNGCPATASTTINEPTLIVLNTSFVNANCGQANGSACVVASGGTAPFTYSWSNGQTTSCINNVLGGTYLVTVTDANLCTQNTSVTVPDLNGPSVAIIAQTNVTCNGLNNGSATVNMLGGTGIFTTQWSASAGSQTTPTASNLTVGVYSVTITDAVGCVASTSITITEPNSLLTIQNSTDPSCFNICDGVLSLAASGGTIPYTYLWQDALNNPVGGNTNSITGLCSGNYTLVFTDANGCTNNFNYSLINPTQITGSTSSTNVICNGACDGTSTVTPNNGFIPYTYLWSDPSAQTTQTASNLCTGAFTVTVTDNNGCQEIFNSTITEPPLLTSSITIFGDVSCSGLCDGFAQVDIAGGVAPYQILWSNGSSNQVATNLCLGSYTVTITDANGCTTESNITITTPNPIVLGTSKVDLTCNNVCIGQATVNISGGVTPYAVQWNNPTFDITTNITNQCAGTYTASVIDDNGCTANTTVVITEPGILDFTYTAQNSNCLQANGQICTNVIGGVAPYFYQWDDAFLQTTACAFNIVAGCYNLTVTDGNGCVKDSLICINDIAAPTLNLVSFTDETCNPSNDGSITVVAAGGTGALTIEWFDGLNAIIPPYTNLTTVSNLDGDNYAISVTDATGCVSSLTQFILEPAPVVAAITSTTDPLCFGACDGLATVSASGGDGSYIYLWTAGSAPASINNTGLCAGNISVTVTDGNGCSSTATNILGQPTLVTANTNSVTNISCFGVCDGSISTAGAGGTPPYTYSWTLNVSAGPLATNLCSNTYTTVVTDANGCFTALINDVIEPANLTVSTAVVNSTCTQCNGEATSNIIGGTAPYNYQWSTGASLTTPNNTGICPGPITLNITDDNGCIATSSNTIIDEAGPSITGMTFTAATCFGLNNGTATVNTTGGTGTIIYDWNPGTQTSQTATGLAAGNYCVSITDQNACPAAQCINVTQPSQLNAIGDLDATICFGDSTQVWASGQGGTPPYTINWINPGLTGVGPIMVNPAVSTNYCFNVTDANGCESPNDCVIITVRPPLTLTLSPDTDICIQSGTSLTANASGGNGGPYTFTWTDDSGNPVTSTVTGNSSTINVNPTATTTYYVVLSDGCTSPINDSVIVTVSPLPLVFVNVVDPSGCAPFGAQFITNSDIGVLYEYDFQCDGIIDVSSANPNGNFLYPAAGTYDVCVTVTTADGCSTTSSNIGMVTVFPVPVADFTFTPTTTTILNPIIDFTNTTAGGSAYSWDFGDGNILPAGSGNIANGTHSGTTSGTYMNPTHIYGDTGTYTITLTATNQFGCTDVISYDIIIEGEYVIYVPNSFTPDGDGINDDFFPQGIGIDRDHFKFMIFNRWGELIFETENPDNHWDGKYKGILSQTDVYVWKIQTRDQKNLQHDHIGHVTLLK